MEKEIKEALSALDEIKNLLKRETELALRAAKGEFLIWGLYQLVASLFVHFTQDFRYFYFLLPFFFLLDNFKWTKWTAVIYWLLAFGVYILLLASRFTYFSFGLFSLIMILGLYFNMRKATRNTRFAFMPTLWGYILFFCVLLTFASIKSKTPELLYLLWPGVIVFALGLWGLFSERSLFLFSFLTNLAGFIAFLFLKAHAIALTMTVYGIFYIAFYVYLNLKLMTG